MELNSSLQYSQQFTIGSYTEPDEYIMSYFFKILKNTQISVQMYRDFIIGHTFKFMSWNAQI